MTTTVITLILLANIILFKLGAIHLYYTFFTKKFDTRNSATSNAMKTDYTILTNRTTVWNAWIGFNGSHSLGAMFIGIVNCYLIIKYPDLILQDYFIFSLNIFVCTIYLWLAKRYWFRIPEIGISASLMLQISALLISLFYG